MSENRLINVVCPLAPHVEMISSCTHYIQLSPLSHSVAAIIGLSAGAVVVIAIIVIILLICRRRRGPRGIVYGGQPGGTVIVQQGM